MKFANAPGCDSISIKLQISHWLGYGRAVSRPLMDLNQLPDQLMLDGGFGTTLMARGLDVGSEPTASWNLSHATEVSSIHTGFIAAGAGAIQTNTFGANRFALDQYGCSDVEGCNVAGVRLAREAAAGESVYVIGSLGPSGRVPPPQGSANLADLESVFAEQAGFLAEAGVDFLHAETMVHPKELRAVLRGIRLVAPKLPVVASFACRVAGESYKTTLGFSLESMLTVCLEEKVDGIGANCMLMPCDMLDLVSAIRMKTDLPVFAKPTIAPDGGPPLYPDEFARGVADLFARGARAVGGCCGTGVEDIAAAADLVSS